MRNSGELKSGADAVVVGGGVVGLSIARELGRRGLSVVLVERGRAGAESSHAAGGMLAPQSEADSPDEFFMLQCASRDLYPQFAAALREETGIDIELEQTGTLYLAFTDEDVRDVERRYLWQARAGLAVERLTTADALLLEPRLSRRVRLALRFPNDWQVENRRLVAALVASVDAYGVQVLTATEVSGVCVERGRVAGVETSRGRIGAGAVVLAAGAWTSLVPVSSVDAPTPRRHPRIEPVRGQMLCFDARPPVVRHVVYTPRGYLVPRLDGRMLAGSTTERAGFDKSMTGAGVQSIISHASEIAPAVGELALVEMWAGLRPRAEDEWPVMGASAETRGLYYATGHYRNGILLAPLTGKLVAASILDDAATPALDPFTPQRFERAAVASVVSNGE